MRSILIYIFSVTGFVLCSFGQTPLDTIEVSKGYKTILIFPENIVESIVGNEIGFVAAVPQPNGNRFHLRLLKLYYDDLVNEHVNFTNHHVITESGFVYDFILKLVERPKKLTWYIKQDRAAATIGSPTKYVDDTSTGKSFQQIKKSTLTSTLPNDGTIKTTGIKATSLPKNEENLYGQDPESYYHRGCGQIQFNRARISRYFSRTDDLFLWLKGIYYNEDELYMQLSIENNEGVDFDINFIKFQIATNYRGSSSNQRRELEPLYSYKQPQSVAGKSENHFVVVFQKFALDVRKELIIEVDESAGNRNLSMAISHELINNPIDF